MKTMLRAGVIGVGSMGRNHARIYADMDGVELVAVADPDPENRNAVQQKYRCNSYAHYADMLENEQLDLVSVVVPTRYHFAVAKDVIHAGVALLIEKPIAATLEEGHKLISLARQRGVLMTVGHIERFNPAIIAMKQRLERHELGNLFQISVRRVGPFPHRIGDVGVVLDLATHDMDILRYLTGSEIQRMQVELAQRVHSQHEDMLNAILRFANGMVGMLDINWLTPTKIRELSVIGERGMLVANYLTQDLHFYENDWCQDEHWPELTQMGVSEGKVIRLKVQRREPLYEELRAFCTSVRLQEPPAMCPEDALEALALAQQLIATGKQPERPTLELATRAVGMPVY